MTMLTLSDMRGLPVPEQLFSYASAYRDASVVLCQKMISDPTSSTWPHAAAVLMLAAHAVELFLKAALLTRNVTNVWDFGHSIDRINEVYREQFKETLFEWDIPFAPSLPEKEWIAMMMEMNQDITEKELLEMKSATPDPSILYRYPVNRRGVEWNGLYGFEPHSFLVILSQVERDFHRIKSQLV
jgi:hypothetical protein